MKSVLITGSSRGVGKETAFKFAREGYHVFINCHSSLTQLDEVALTLEKIHPSCCTKLVADISSAAEVSAMFKEINRISGGLDVLINNAGVSYWGLLEDMSICDWDKVIQTNLSSCFYCTKEALPSMIHNKAGCIINISSIWGHSGASCEVAYSASKAGIHGYTKALAKELAPSNVQVNAVSLGVMDTQMNAAYSDEELEVLREEIPAGRFGTPKEAAQMIWQLANSPSYLTGQIIRMDGGFL